MTETPESTKDVLRRSRYRIEPRPYAWVRAGRVDRPERHLLVARDDRETTVVTHEENLSGVEVLERNPDLWSLVSIDCANPFYCVGFLAAIGDAFARRAVDILALSTMTRDLIFVKSTETNRVHEALGELGLVESLASRETIAVSE